MEILSNTNIVIYHYPCPDGELSASIFKTKYKNSIFIPWMHENKQKNIDTIINYIIDTQENKPTVYFLDYCPDFMLALKISYLVKNVIIIDHHKSACDKFNSEFEENLKKDSNLANIKLNFNNKKSGCQLTWEYCNPNKEYPLSVKHIGNRDIWVWDDINTEPFTSAYHLHYDINKELTPKERLDIYKKILECDENTFNIIVKKGESLIKNMRNECLELLPTVRPLTDFDINGKQLMVIEIPMIKYHLTKYIQELIKSKYPEHQVLRLAYKKELMNVYSLRSLHDEICVDLLAQKYGGNGHSQASGYSINL
jgi:hypothetical protein